MQPFASTRYRCYPGLQISPDLTFIFDSRIRRKLAGRTRLEAGAAVTELAPLNPTFIFTSLRWPFPSTVLAVRHSRCGGMTSQPRVIILDANHADACANETFKGLKANPLTSHIPVIAVSTDAYPAKIQAGIKAGLYRYLTKPCKLPDLMDAIDDSMRYTLGSALEVM